MATELSFFRLENSAGGYIGIAVPVFYDEPTRGHQKYSTVSELEVDYPEFNPGATVYTGNSRYAANLIDLGFTNVIDLSQHVGETWTINNDSKIRITEVLNPPGYNMDFIEPGGESSGFFFSSEDSTSITAYLIRSFPALAPLNDKYNQYIFGPIGVGGIGHTQYISQTMPGDASFYYNFWNGAAPEIGEDPYEAGGESGTGGGTGTFSGTGDQIGIPALPTLSAVDAGFITLFNPTAGQMAQLSNYMWNNPLFDLDNWKKVFANPMDAILGLSIVPVDVPAGGARTVKVGNISTGIGMTVAASQYVEVDCGSLNVQEFWGAYLDYEPYTTAEIYLPYCGTHSIKVDDIMGKSVHVVYHVDILSGGCCCYVQCGGTVLYTFIGHCSVSIPITGDNWTRVVNGAIQIAGSIGSMVSSGGANISGMTGIASAAANIAKPSIEKSGAMGGPGGILAVQTPYLILTRPRQALPANQNSFTGYPSFITETLSTLSGYTKVYSVHLEGIPATDSEITEIENLLKGGVIF